MLRTNSDQTNNNSVFKRRERKMLVENLLPPLPVKLKKKPNVNHGELNMPTILNTELKKSTSSDKLKKSLPPN
jgi:hypothetical protein